MSIAMKHPPRVSFVISTYNRRDALLGTLKQVFAVGGEAGEFDVHVVDNASTDGTSTSVLTLFPDVKLLRSPTNRGSVAKNLALPNAHGQYVVFLDDDSYPMPGSVARMVEHFEADEQLGAATFVVTLPDGSRECSAYPDVFIGCGVGLRRRALRLIGGLPDDFFMQAEEYDLSLRLLDGGWHVKRFDDLHVTHLKTPRSRLPDRTIRLDARNNMLLALRRFPTRHLDHYLVDWTRRYFWIARSQNATGPFLRGAAEGVLRWLMWPKRTPVSAKTFETFAKLKETRRRLHNTVLQHRAMRVLLVDAGKNLYAYWRACHEIGVDVVGVADNKLGQAGRTYRGVPLLPDAEARLIEHDLCVIANLSPEHAKRRLQQWLAEHDRPTVDLFAEPSEPQPLRIAA